MPNKSLLLSPFIISCKMHSIEEVFPQMLHSRGCARVSVGALNELNGLNTEKRKKDN